jgi:hypothetical protein
MKKKLLIALVALVGTSAFSQVHATPVAYTNNDIILAFESTFENKDLLIDLGQGSAFASALSGGSFSSINIYADLTNAFGSDWASNTTNDVQWGLFSISTSKTIVYASVAVGGNPLPLKSPNALSTTATAYSALISGYTTALGNSDYATNGLGVYQNITGSTGKTTWIGNTTTAPYFGVYNVSLVNGVGGNIDIYGTTGSTSIKEGTLTIGSDGTISAVPEPSTYALFGFGALLMSIAYRRSTRRNIS